MAEVVPFRIVPKDAVEGDEHPSVFDVLSKVMMDVESLDKVIILTVDHDGDLGWASSVKDLRDVVFITRLAQRMAEDIALGIHLG